jgi:hypothetical protein
MTPAEHTQRTRTLTDLIDSKGWRDELAPALRKQIAAIEAAILEAGEKELDDTATREARRQRQFLLTLLDKPEQLIRDLNAGMKLSSKSASRHVT